MDRKVAVAPPSSERLAHRPEHFLPLMAPARARLPVDASVPAEGAPRQPTRLLAIALTAEGLRRGDLVAWAGAHRSTLSRMRILAPAEIGGMLAEHAGLTAEHLRSGTRGPTGSAGLTAAGDIDAVIAFTDPLEFRPGETTTRSLGRLAAFWDIPTAGNRVTADLLLAALTSTNSFPAATAVPVDVCAPDCGPAKLWTVRATVDDVPGCLAILAASLARRAINILSVQIHLTPDGPVDELLVAASPVLTSTDLMAAAIDGGARTPLVTPAEAQSLVDGPTRALALATRLVCTPEDLPAVLTGLLPGAEVAWRAEPPAGFDHHPGQLWLTDPTGGGYLLTRPALPFTPAECARAYAMLQLVGMALAQGQAAEVEAWRMLLADGEEVTVRRAEPDDVGAVTDLHARCSPTSRLRRYLAGARCPSPSVLTELLSPTAGHALVAEDPDGRVVALANLMWEAETPELAILVEDDRQGLRLGTALARRLAAAAAKAGARSVKAIVHAGNTPMARIMSGLGVLHREYDGGLLTLIVTLPAGHTQRLPNSM